MTLDKTQMVHFPSLARLRPPRVVTTVAWLILIGIVLAVAILFVPWLQTAQGGGQVTTLKAEDRARDVSSLVDGRVEEFYVKDGDFVRTGDPIVRVVDVDPDFLERLASEKAQFEAQIAAIQQARATASIDVGRTGQLYAEGLAARRDYEQTQIKVAEADAKLAEARAKLKQIEIKLTQNSAQVVSAPPRRAHPEPQCCCGRSTYLLRHSAGDDRARAHHPRGRIVHRRSGYPTGRAGPPGAARI